MKLTDFNFPDKEIRFGSLLDIMRGKGFIFAEQWDYERAMFDLKMPVEGDPGVFYLRVPVFAVDGDIPGDETTVKLMTPILGRHYYPHGVEHGEEENFPDHIVDKCKQLLTSVDEEL
ncbi:YugN family protein [Natribacillus halophilus]|uniref:YugN-like family protein n=1 Tax=Natribacillus halophilus TaxID=549003 RepID=A0A1G8MCT2_9BACI|nr:YugN family protein [Natribacillus halophilus]SDI65748.1 YugN-like family protein [Natribacillus halophilus]